MQPRAPLETRLWALAVFGGGGLLLIACITPDIFRGFASESWGTTEGVVQTASLKQDSNSNDGDPGAYRVHLTYQFTVSEQTHEGWRHTSMGEFYTYRHEKAQAFLDRYAVGTKVSVYYDAQNPSDAVLTRGVDYRYWTILGFGIAMIGFSAIVWWCRPVPDTPQILSAG